MVTVGLRLYHYPPKEKDIGYIQRTPSDKDIAEKHVVADLRRSI